MDKVKNQILRFAQNDNDCHSEGLSWAKPKDVKQPKNLC